MLLLIASVAVAACSQVPASLDPPEQVAQEQRRSDGQTPAEPLKPTVRWRDCGKRFDCGKVRVPIDHARPNGKKVELALIRLPAPEKAQRIGSLIVNPGGPGGSGVDFVRSAAVDTVPAEVRAKFDIVGFDPRGVGKSHGLSCGEAPQSFLSRDFIPDSQSALTSVLDAAQAVAAACAADNAELLPHMSTSAVAKDLDAIRRAVGDHKLTYLGFSYGSTIGLTYAEQFPDSVRALVLDGPVDPAIDGHQRARDQAGVLERTLVEFFRTCPQEVECRGYAKRLSLRRFDNLMGRLEANPMPAWHLPGRELRPAEALLATAALLKDRGLGWPTLAAAIASAEEGDGSLFLAVAESAMREDTGRRQWLAPLLAVNCLDIPAPAAGSYPRAVDQLRRESRHFGPLLLLMASPCTYWEQPPQRRPAPVVAPKAPPTVVVGTTGDPTTPYHWAKAVAKHLRRSVLLTRDGAGHTAFGQRNVCTDRSVSRYLVDLVLPKTGSSCG